MIEHGSKIPNVLNRLKDVGNKIPEVPCVYPLQEPVFGIGVSQSDIAQLERIILGHIPDDFLLFQKLCGSISAMDVWNGYSLFEASHIKALIMDAHSLQFT